MTIEIKQLVIRAVADPGRDRTSPMAVHAPFVPPSAPAAIRSDVHPTMLAEQREAIVASCVREVLRKLERSRER
jgi:hypothetical protein